MAIDNANYVGQLDDNLPQDLDPVTEGAAQIRAVKNALTNTFPNVSGIVNADHNELNALTDQPNTFVKGMVIMFSGTAAVPDGWAECDGQSVNGFTTPDLRSKFIKAYDNRETEQPGTLGGDNNPDISTGLTVDEHVLGVTEMPSHSHSYKDRYYIEDKAELTGEGATTIEDTPTGYNNGVGSSATDTDNNAFLYIESDTEDTGGGQGHSHGLTSDGTFDNQPEFYLMKFICYVGV